MVDQRGIGSVAPRLPLWAAVTLLAALAAAAGRAATGQEGVDDRQARSEEMRRIVGSFVPARGEDAGGGPVALRAEPLLRWNDPTRMFSDASLWAWGAPGRPAALLALELYPHSEAGADFVPSWAYEFVSLDDGPLRVRGEGGLTRWAPGRPGVTFRDVPGAPGPADSAAGRQAQMGELVKRFTSAEHPGGDVTLRLMPRPICRYSDPAAGQLDGAVYVFATGTNPEVLILLEAQGRGSEGPTWRYAVARVTAAPYEVFFDRREVWREGYAGRQKDPGEPYFTERLPRKVAG